MIKNSASRRFGFRVRMRGTSSLRAKRTGDFGNAIADTRIGDWSPSRVFAKNSEPGNFRLLQQYRHDSDLLRCPLRSPLSGGIADQICSLRVLRLMTLNRHKEAYFGAMHRRPH